MQRLSLLTVAFLSLLILPVQAQECNCATAFDKVVHIYENDYALFNIKVTDQNRDLYNAYTDVYRTKAQAVKEIENCLPVLEQWLQFFRDGHNRIAFTGTSGNENRSERIDIDRNSFKADYKRKGYKKNELLGIWSFGAFDVALLPQPNNRSGKQDYVGVIVSSTNKRWQPGEVKFKLTWQHGNEYDALMFMDDKGAKKLKATLSSAHKLEFKNFNYWTKTWPGTAPAAALADETNQYSEFHFRMLEDGVPYLRFPNFYEREPEFVDSLLKAHHQALVNAAFIIVDVRDNAGGNDAVYRPLLPYILSGPVQIPTVGLWMSEGNLATYLEGKDPADFNEEETAKYNYLMSLKNSIYWMDPEKDARTYTPDTLYAPQRKVAVLVNGKTLSSGETFVFRAMQSNKVILYGQNTAGIVDGFMVLTKSIDCFDLRHPSAFRAKDVAENPVDPYGFEPDVYISPEVDALEFSLQHMQQLLKTQAQ